MLDIPPLATLSYFGDEDKRDLFFGACPALRFAQGAVAEKCAHITLLDDIHPLGEAYVETVRKALEGWEADPIQIEEIGFFPSSVEGESYNVIVGHVHLSQNLLEGRKRLTDVLNYTPFFPDYKAHVTLAYVKGTADLDKWQDRLRIYEGQTFVPLGVNFGVV